MSLSKHVRRNVFMKQLVKHEWLLGLAITFFCTALYAAMSSFRMMPVSEGWYTEYAWLINHGKLPYRDFEYLFFPLYTFIVAGITRVFGYSIIVLRIVGVILFGAIGAAIYALLARLFDRFSAVVAAVVAALYMQSELAQIYYDYIRFHDLFAILATILLVAYSQKCFAGKVNPPGKSAGKSKVLQVLAPTILLAAGVIGLAGGTEIHGFLFALLIALGGVWLTLPLLIKKWKGKMLPVLPFQTVLCGIFISAECMIKQSNGMIMIAFVLVYFLFCAVTLKSKDFWLGLMGVITGMALSFGILLVYLAATKSFDPFMESCFGSALAAKGGLMVVAFRRLPDVWAEFWNYKNQALILVLVLDLLVGYTVSRKAAEKEETSVASTLILAGCGVVLAGICVAFGRVRLLAEMAAGLYEGGLASIVYFPCAIAFACFGAYILLCFAAKKELDPQIKQYLPLFPLLGVIFAQGYGSIMSISLGPSQTALGLGLIIAFCLHQALAAKRTVLLVALSVYVLFNGATFAARKSMEIYNWWSLTQGTVWQNTQTADVPLLEGIKIREEDKIMYETVYQDVVTNTQEGEAIFTFPHCPIFYTITDRHSVTYGQVQWFDVSSAQTIQKDIETLREHPPKVIIYVDVPESVYQWHQNMFNTVQTAQMKDFILKELLVDNEYELLHTFDLGNEYSISTYCLEK